MQIHRWAVKATDIMPLASHRFISLIVTIIMIIIITTTTITTTTLTRTRRRTTTVIIKIKINNNNNNNINFIHFRLWQFFLAIRDWGGRDHPLRSGHAEHRSRQRTGDRAPGQRGHRIQGRGFGERARPDRAFTRAIGLI